MISVGGGRTKSDFEKLRQVKPSQIPVMAKKRLPKLYMKVCGEGSLFYSRIKVYPESSSFMFISAHVRCLYKNKLSF